MSTRRRWHFSLRSLFVGITAAAVAHAFTTWLGLAADDIVIIVAAIAAVLLETFVHRIGLRRMLRRKKR